MNRRLLLGLAAAAVLLAVAGVAAIGAVMVWGAIAFSEGLFPSADFTDATEAEVEAAGYRLPDGAAHVHVKDRAAMDVRTTWLSYELPPATFDALHAEVAAKATPAAQVTPPADWPDFAIFDDFDPPPWWAPAGAVFVRESPYTAEPGKPGSSYTTGSLWAFDVETHRVWWWSWSWQWWGFEP